MEEKMNHEPMEQERLAMEREAALCQREAALERRERRTRAQEMLAGGTCRPELTDCRISRMTKACKKA